VPAFWTNEYEVPQELLALINEPTIPKDLKDLITKAKDEVDNHNAVTYTTKANIENKMHEYHELLISYWKNVNEQLRK
jgi:hypothetical protein